MKQDSNKQIKLGMMLNYLNLGIGNLIPFLYTPIMLELLGQSEYGLYKIASSTTSYLSLMAFGIGSAVSRFIIKARTKGDKNAEERMFGLFNLLFQAVAFLTLVVGLIITCKLELIYGASLNSYELKRMRILVALMVLNTAINFSATSYNAVVSSHERFIFIQSVNILSTIGAPVLNLVILFMGYRSVGMATMSLALSIIIRLLYITYVRKSLHIRPRYKEMPTHDIPEIFAFSFWIFISNIVSRIYTSTDMIIIGAIPALSTIGAAVYSVGNTFSSIMFNLAQVTPGLFAPKANKMVFSGATNRELSDLMIKVGRLQGYVVALVCSGFVAFGVPFLYCYVGPEYWEAYWVAVIVMIPNCIPLVQSVANSIQQAKGMHQFRAKVYIVIAVVNIVGTIMLAKRFGIIGAALPTGIAYLLGHGFVMNWYYWKRICLDIPRFWGNLLPIFGVSAALCVLTLVASRWINFYGWARLGLGILTYTVIYCITLWFVIFNKDEKAVITRFVCKISKRGL